MPLPGGRYVACQVLGRDAQGTLTVGALDWMSAQPPRLDELESARPLMLDHHAHSGEPAVIKVSAYHAVPADLHWLGRMTPTAGMPTESQSWSGWEYLPYQVDAQRTWDALPESLRAAYRAAATQSPVDIDLGAGPMSMSARSSQLDLRAAAHGLPPSGPVDWSFLGRLPRLTTLYWAGDDRGLSTALTTHPLIRTLYWHDAPHLVDLSGTAVTDLWLTGDALRMLRLPGQARSLELTEPSDDLSVAADADGRGLRLSLRTTRERIMVPAGLARARQVQLGAAGSCTLSSLAGLSALAELQVRLDGPPGALTDAAALAAHRQLHALRLRDAYALDADTLPELPSLRLLELDGVRRSVVAPLRARYRGTGVKVVIRGAKSDTWLAANFTNPFRDWADDSARFGAAACKAYAAARTAVDAIPADAPDRVALAERPLRDLVAALNRIDTTHGMIDTIRREEAGDAFADLARLAGVPPQLAEDWFDTDRDF